MKKDDNSDRPGDSAYCGSKCTKHVVNFTSSVDQNVYIAAHLWDARGQAFDCNPQNYSIFFIYDEGTNTHYGMQFSRGAAQHQNVFAMKAGESLSVTLELDFSNETVRDWSVVAWGD